MSTRKIRRTLRKKGDRLLLWRVAEGQCVACGAILDDNWEADHEEPFVITQRTNLFEMQALCRKCNRTKGATMARWGHGQRDRHRDWESYFTPSADFRIQKGQAAAFEIAARVNCGHEDVLRQLFRLVTGYGKTLLAYGFFWILRERGLVDNMLVLTQSDDQRKQFADDVADALHLLGISLQAWVVEKNERDVRAVREGKASVFVATYQQLSERDSFLPDMLAYGGRRWLVVLDECHHLSVDGFWAQQQEALPNVVARIGLSATPERTDAKRLLGLPVEPTVRVDYKDAWKEKVVKRVQGFVQAYAVHVNMDGHDQELTTADLRDVKDMNAYETRKQLRWVSGYVDQMLLDALNDLCDRETAYPGQNQMVVFCMTCQHAEHVCEEINRLSIAHQLGVEARWAGVGAGIGGLIKSTPENRAILEAFKKGEFGALVQVAIAREGFNNKRISVIAFLHLLNADAPLLQQIGRGLRRNAAIPFDDDTVSIYASSDTPIAKVIKAMEAQVNEAADELEDEQTGTSCGVEGKQLRLWDIPDLMVLDATYQDTEIITADGVDPLTPTQEELRRKYGIPVEEMLAALHGARARGVPQPQFTPGRQEQQTLKSLEGQVEAHMKTLASNMFKVMIENGLVLEHERDRTTIIGQIKRSIHAQWNRESKRTHASMLREDFEAKNQWLKKIGRELKQTREIPSWVKLNQ